MRHSKEPGHDLGWILTCLRKAKPHATAVDAAMVVAGGTVSLVLCSTVPWRLLVVAGPMLVVGAMLAAGAAAKHWTRRGCRRRSTETHHGSRRHGAS